MADLRLAKIVKMHAKGPAADIIFCDDGSRVPFVPMTAGAGASTNTGRVSHPNPTPAEGDDPYSLKDTDERDVFAVVGFIKGRPLIVDLYYPQVSQMQFEDEARFIDRLPSDIYSTADGAANWEWSHPSGTYVRVGTTIAHEDLTGLDYDKKWKIAQNTDSQPHVYMAVSHGGQTYATFHIDPSGNLEVVVAGNSTFWVHGNAFLTVDGDITSQANSWAHTGPVSIDGDVSFSGSSVTHGGVNIGKDHHHSGVQTGLGETGNPV